MHRRLFLVGFGALPSLLLPRKETKNVEQSCNKTLFHGGRLRGKKVLSCRLFKQLIILWQDPTWVPHQHRSCRVLCGEVDVAEIVLEKDPKLGSCILCWIRYPGNNQIIDGGRQVIDGWMNPWVHTEFASKTELELRIPPTSNGFSRSWFDQGKARGEIASNFNAYWNWHHSSMRVTPKQFELTGKYVPGPVGSVPIYPVALGRNPSNIPDTHYEHRFELEI